MLYIWELLKRIKAYIMNLDKLEKEISLFYDAINKLEDIEIVVTPTSDFDESLSWLGNRSEERRVGKEC